MRTFLVPLFMLGLFAFAPAAMANCELFDDCGPIASFVDDDDFDFWQHDFAATTGKAEFSARFFSNRDYAHGQVDYALFEHLTVGYRYAVDGGVDEHRARVIVTGLAWGPFDFSPRAEWRQIDDDAHLRLGLRTSVAHEWNTVGVGLYHEPRFGGLGDRDDFEFVGSKTEAAVMFRRGNFRFGPKLIVLLDDNYEKVDVFAGTGVSYSF